MSEEEFGLRPIDPKDTFRRISAGDEAYLPLKAFAQKSARRHEAEHLARTYVLYRTRDEFVAGYITLICSEVSTENGAPLVVGEGLHFPYVSYPAVKIARLLIDSNHRGTGANLGKRLVNFAQGVASEVICPAIGCRFIVVNSKKTSVEFYEKCGFTLLDTEENKSRSEPVMYLDLHRA